MGAGAPSGFLRLPYWSCYCSTDHQRRCAFGQDDLKLDYEHNIQVEFSTNDDFMALEATEIERVILNKKDKKAPGIDLIPGEIIRELFYSDKQWFTNIFNLLLKNGIFPKIWKF
ncbi:hypothetical protein CDAR_83571 [Caerostris darwini]|uniref:Reverse transcriptase n=1 Tax=Caerostris darwini TaxID=1538125 RepID=A0AAV4NJ66_9ARAC|nr:hypothetical protein CDAR_83571 [Caerostris darwini]